MRKLVLISLCLVLFAFVSAEAATHVVKPDGTGDYATIQAAINAASNTDIIELTDGTFTGSGNREIDYLGKAITVRSQSGDPSTCIIDCQDYDGIKFVKDEGQNSVLEGVTITNGKYGIICGVSLLMPHHGSPTINNCIISYNSGSSGMGTGYDGGGMKIVEHSSPQINDCQFIENSSRSSGIGGIRNGGGIYCLDSSPVLDNCIFVDNSASGSVGGGIGGGMYCNGSTPSLENCTFVENTSNGSGGGFGSENSRPTFTSCTFARNTAGSMGGAVACGGAGGIFDYCTFYGNSAASGGAIYTGQTSVYRLEMTHCTLYGNSAPYGAGIFLHTTTSAALINNTIIAYGLQGEAVYCYSASATLTCCDVYGNAGGDYVGCIAGQDTVRNNFSKDPRFCDPVNEDFTINNQSPCHPLSIPCGLVGAHGVGCTGPLTYYVCPDGSGDFTTIQAAINTALDGDIIELCDATFTGNGNRDLNYLGKAVTVRSQSGNPEACIIDCQSGARGVNFISGEGSNSVLQGITITNGYDSPIDQAGAGVLIDGSSPTINNCIFSYNQAMSGWGSFGGGICCNGGSPAITDCNFYHNTAFDDGGGLANFGSVTLEDCNFVENSTTGNGGGIVDMGSSCTLLRCFFSNNTADYYGGGLSGFGSSCQADYCVLTENSADVEGGGMYFGNHSEPNLTNCTFNGNWAVDGGGMSNSWSSSSVVTDCNFTENEADYGGGMYNSDNGEPTLTNCTFSSNSAEIDGGGLYSSSSDPNVIECMFVENSAGNVGGAMWNGQSNPQVSNCVFLANEGQDGGGGIANVESSPTVINCSFISNKGLSSVSNAGGLYNILESHPTVTNCLFSNNSAQWGGAVSNIIGSCPTITNCTVVANLATGACGGINDYNEANPIITNCILWDNTPPQISDYIMCTATVSYSDVQGGWTGAGVGNIDADPCFVDPNGSDGVIGTEDDNLRLLLDSPCIDTGDNTSVPPDTADLDSDGDMIEQTPLDIDGRPRFVDGDCNDTIIVDMGAYEFSWAYIGDFEGNDCDVDFYDYAIFALAWLTEDGEAQYNPACDISLPPDNYIDWLDLEMFVDNWLAGT